MTDDVRLVRDRAGAAKEDLVALCRDLVACPSVNPPGDTRAVADVVSGYLHERAVPAQLVARDPLMPSVVATIDGARPGRHLVLNVHLDTMDPGDSALWTVPVFQLTRRDGRLYGLGMGNMKGAVAAMAWAAALLAEQRDRWAGRVTFTAVSDECVFGDNGAAHLLATQPELRHADGLICGEGPGFMRLAVAEKGLLWLAIEATGEGGHASRAVPGAGAVPRLARVVADVDALGGQHADLPAGLEELTADTSGRTLAVNVGTLHGGSFVSQVSTAARAEVDARLPPGLAGEQVQRRIAQLAAAVPGVTVARIKGWDANWTSSQDPFIATFAAAVSDIRGKSPTPCVRHPASDASRWRRLGVPALCYGPQPLFSAGVDDYAEEQDVLDCAAAYALGAWRFLRIQGVAPPERPAG